MAAPRPYPFVTVTEKARKSLKEGHPWVYESEILSSEGCSDGDICDVFSEKGSRWLGAGFYNSASKIRVRIVSVNTNDRFDEAFWQRRIKYAIDYRRTVMGKDFSACRLIFGEADFLPGLTVDRFGDVLSTQCTCLGIDKIKEMLYSFIVEELRRSGDSVSCLYEHKDIALRGLEGLDVTDGEFSRVCGLGSGSGRCEITENGVRYNVDYKNGQKTGFFLDQKYNRLAVAKIAENKRVLDCFTHTGAFALNAALAGAEYVRAVDVSKEAVEMTVANVRLNGLDGRVDCVCADVFDMLDGMLSEKKKEFDFIILDPPAFTKSSSTIKNAMAGYRRINTAAMRLLPRGGYLATCSCSHFMRTSLFCEMLHQSARDAGVRLRQIEARQQSPDHPVLWSVPETDYLKFFIFQVV